MKKIIYLTLILTSFAYGQKVRDAKMKVTCSASDASITENGKSAGPEQFSVKILSEKGEPGVSVKDDEKFKEWDRVLRKYSKIIEELQNRL